MNVRLDISGDGYWNKWGEFIELRKGIENIMDRFKGYDVGGSIDYGFNINDNYVIRGDFVEGNIKSIEGGYIRCVGIKVRVCSNYENGELRYEVCGDGNSWG